MLSAWAHEESSENLKTILIDPESVGCWNPVDWASLAAYPRRT